MSQESKKQVPGSIFALKCKFSVNMIKKSFTKRHWSNQELVTTDIKSIVLLNGTELVISRSDLMERTILLPTKKLKAENIRNENEMESAFRAELPRILGACLKLVAKASNDTKYSRKLRLDIH